MGVKNSRERFWLCVCELAMKRVNVVFGGGIVWAMFSV